MMPPITSTPMVVNRPTVTEERVPKMTRAYTSQPCWVKPSGCPAAGPPSELASWHASDDGSIDEKSPGKSDTATTTRIRNAEIRNSGCLRRFRQASAHRLSGAWSSLTLSVACRGVSAKSATKCSMWRLAGAEASGRAVLESGVIADPRVKPGVQQVNEQVGEAVDQHQHGDNRDHRGAFAGQHGPVEAVADAGHVEDAFSDDRAAHQAAQVRAKEGDDGDQGVAQNVHPDHSEAGQALRGGGAHVVRAHVFNDGSAGQAQHVGEGREAQHDGRQDQVLHRGCGTDGRFRPAQLHTDGELQQEAQDEDRDADDDQGRHQDGRVEELALTKAGDQAEDDAEDAFEDQGHHREAGGHGEDLAKHGGDGTAGEVLAEVEGEDALEVEQVLDPERLVQVVLGPQFRGDGLVDRLVSEQGDDGVTGEAEDQEVDQQCCAQEDGNQLEKALEDVCRHQRSTPLSAGIRSRDAAELFIKEPFHYWCSPTPGKSRSPGCESTPEALAVREKIGVEAKQRRRPQSRQPPPSFSCYLPVML